MLQETPPAGKVRGSERDAGGGRPAARLSPSGPALGATAGVHVLEIFQPAYGGVPAYVEMLVPGLLAAGVRVSAACPSEGGAADRLRALGVPVLELDVERAPRPLSDAVAMQRLAHFGRRQGVSLVHAHSTKAGLLGALTAARLGIPSLFTPHGWSFERLVAPPLRGAYALYERQMVRHFHAGVLTVSASGRRAAERWRVSPRGQVQTVPTGLPPAPAPGRAAARLSLGLAAGDTVAAWVGRTGPQKRPEDLAAIARRLAGRVRVVALCQGAHGTRVERELRAAGVILASSAHDVGTVYAAADMLIHTSAWEAAPLSVLEAMRAGLPVVAYDVGGLGEQVRPGRTGYLIASGDTEMAAECALSLARRPELRARMGQAARHRLAEEFRYGDMVRQLVATYLEFAAVPEGALAPPPSPPLALPEPARWREPGEQPASAEPGSGRRGFQRAVV